MRPSCLAAIAAAAAAAAAAAPGPPQVMPAPPAVIVQLCIECPIWIDSKRAPSRMTLRGMEGIRSFGFQGHMQPAATSANA